MSQLVGYSDKINDPRYQRFQESNKKGTLIFSIVISIIALVGFPIYSTTSNDMDIATSLLIGLFLAVIFMAIAFVQLYKQKKDFTWDGVVVDKKMRERQHQQHPDDQHMQYYTEYVLKVKRNDGRVITHRNKNNPNLYNYLNIGDYVRHHKGFHIYEKYDKSNDKVIICVACSTINNIENELCTKCKCPLLKN